MRSHYRSRFFIFGVLSLSAVVLTSSVRAEEGFWLFSNPPLARMKAHHGWIPSPAFLDRLVKASARLDSGGNSGAFVSSEGLWLTNNHIGRAFIRRLSEWPEIEKNGFYAATPDRELRLPPKVLNTVVRVSSIEAIEDVTKRVLAAKSPAERNRVIAAIQDEATDATHRGQIVRLFGGSRYQLQRLKIYTDIRLVFVPEQKIAALDDGGDAQAPEFPDSFNLDIAVFRIYENGKPIHPKQFLSLSAEPVREGELLVGAGTPGYSARYRPMGHVAFERDVRKQLEADMARRLFAGLVAASARSASAIARLERALRLGREDTIYADVRLAAYRDAARLAAPAATERAIAARFEDDPVWTGVRSNTAGLRALYPRFFLFDRAAGFESKLFDVARRLVRLDVERSRPESDRLPAYRDIAAMEAQIASEMEADPLFEEVQLGAWLSMAADCLGYEDPSIQSMLSGQSPLDRARVAARSRLSDPAFRRAMLVPGAASTSDDPLLAMARAIDMEARKARSEFERLDTEADALAARYAALRFDTFGHEAWPEADNTLRLTYGTVGANSVDGARLPTVSTFGDLYRFIDKRDQLPPLTLPSRWMEARGLLDPSTILQFETNVDAVGGSSGTPLVDRGGRIRGVLAAGSGATLANNYLYDSGEDRTIAIAATAILEALRKLYGADALADELSGGQRTAARAKG